MEKRRIFQSVGLAFLALVLVNAPAAPAEEGKPSTTATYLTLTQTLIRFGSLDIYDDDILDDYALMAECKLFVRFYKDEFTWRKIREGIRETIRRHVVTYPTTLTYDTELQLGRYDFENHLFRFTSKTELRNVNAFSFDSTDTASCNNKRPSILPKSYRMLLDQPIYLAGIPMDASQGKSLLDTLITRKNQDRIVSARFTLRATYVSPFKHVKKLFSDDPGYLHQDPDEGRVRINTRLESLNIYLDPEHQQLLYSYQPW